MDILGFLEQLRETITTLIRGGFPEPQASLLLGMVLGVKSGFPDYFYEALKTTGTLHVVVVSGYNISVVINTLARMISFVPLKARILITFVFITLFVLLVGLEPPVIRAAIMGAVGLLGTLWGRQKDAIRAFLVSAVVMLAINPEWIGDLSFQLSFLATLGIIVVLPVLDRAVPRKGGVLREDFLTTFSAQVMVWPLIAFSFGQLSAISLVVNTLVLWTTPVITYLGLVTVIVGLIVRRYIFLLTIPSRIFLDYFIWIVNAFSSLKVGNFEVPAFSSLALAFYFGALFAGLWFLYHALPKKQETS